MKKMKSGGMKMHEGLKRTCPPGDGGMRPSSGSVNGMATRDSTASGHSIGGRTA